jgi:hypothetical protein
VTCKKSKAAPSENHLEEDSLRSLVRKFTRQTLNLHPGRNRDLRTAAFDNPDWHCRWITSNFANTGESSAARRACLNPDESEKLALTIDPMELTMAACRDADQA